MRKPFSKCFLAGNARPYSTAADSGRSRPTVDRPRDVAVVGRAVAVAAVSVRRAGRLLASAHRPSANPSYSTGFTSAKPVNDREAHPQPLPTPALSAMGIGIPFSSLSATPPCHDFAQRDRRIDDPALNGIDRRFRRQNANFDRWGRRDSKHIAMWPTFDSGTGHWRCSRLGAWCDRFGTTQRPEDFTLGGIDASRHAHRHPSTLVPGSLTASRDVLRGDQPTEDEHRRPNGYNHPFRDGHSEGTQDRDKSPNEQTREDQRYEYLQDHLDILPRRFLSVPLGTRRRGVNSAHILKGPGGTRARRRAALGARSLKRGSAFGGVIDRGVHIRVEAVAINRHIARQALASTMTLDAFRDFSKRVCQHTLLATARPLTNLRRAHLGGDVNLNPNHWAPSSLRHQPCYPTVTPLTGHRPQISKFADIYGGPPGDRTQDQLIKSQLLYH